MHKYIIYYRLNGQYYASCSGFLYPRSETATSWFRFLKPHDKIIAVFKIKREL